MRLTLKLRKRRLSNEAYVSLLYSTLLGRAPDPEGQAAHVRFLQRGGDRAVLFNTFVESQEYKNRSRDVRQSGASDEEWIPFDQYGRRDSKLDLVLSASKDHFSDRPYIKSLENLPELVGRKKRPVKTIVAYYHKMRSGGIERVTAWQVSAWVKLGYRVILATDEPVHPDDYPYDERVERVVIPGKMMWSDHGEYVARGRALADVLMDKDADLFVTNLGHEICTVWDILVAKSLDVPVILGWHNVFDADYHDGAGLDAAQIRLLGHRYADLTTVLTTMDQLWFTMNGYTTQVVPNPSTFADLPDQLAPLTGKTIVWLARVEKHQKRIHHALQMMPMVLAEHPDATLIVVGAGPDLDAARELARALGVSTSVRFAGYQEDVSTYLRKAALHVMTSEFEGFGLAIEEAWSFGLPSVMYSLPYLELTKHGKGHVDVAQGDVRGLARAVSDLLADFEERKRLGLEARAVAETYRAQSPLDIWRDILAAMGERNRLGPDLNDLQVSADVRQLVRLLSEKLFPPIRSRHALPVPSHPPEQKLEQVRNIAKKVKSLGGLLPNRGFKPLKMIDCTSIPLGDSFMFFSGLYAMLDNDLPVCADDCVIHTHGPLVKICELLFGRFGLRVSAGPPREVLHPFFYPHPPVSNDDWRRTYMGSDWRMDWVEATDRQKTIGRPGYRDTLRKMAQLFISERLIYRRSGGWRTATPSYIGFRVWWPIALKLGVYPVVFYSMVSRSLGNIRKTLHDYIDAEIATDLKAGRRPFTGNAAFPTGNSYQTIDPDSYRRMMASVGEEAFTCFVQNDSPWHSDFAMAGVQTQHIPSIMDTLKIIRSAANVVTCCSFTSHVAQFLRDDFVLIMFKDLSENNVHPGANPKVLTYNPACSPCNYLPRGQYKTCPAGYDHCIALENTDFIHKIAREIRWIVDRAPDSALDHL